MRNIIQIANDVVDAESKKMRKISKEDFKENLGMVMGQLTNFINTISNIQGTDKTKFAQTISSFAKSPSNEFCVTCGEISKAIRDTKGGFEVFLTTAQNINSVLQMVERNINVLFNEKLTTIYNIKVSQLTVLKVVQEAEIFSNYAVYLFDGVLYEIIVNEGEHELNQPQLYRYEYIRTYKAGIIELMKIGSLPNGANMMITEIDQLRKSLDPTLIDDTNQVNKNLLQVKHKLGIFTGGLSILASIFRYFGEWGVLMRNLKYQKMIQEREWLQNHTDLLKLQLAGVDPNSEEYRKAVKIINTYNDMIRDLDLKINSYMED